MKILITGATGYVGGQLLPKLVESGHEVTCMVRDASRLGRQAYAGFPGLPWQLMRIGAVIAPYAFLGPKYDDQLREVIKAADEYDIAMVFTGKRQFRH